MDDPADKTIDARGIFIWVLIVVLGGWHLLHEGRFNGIYSKDVEVQREFAGLPDKYVRLERYQKDMAGISKDLEAINRKLDRLIERGVGK